MRGIVKKPLVLGRDLSHTLMMATWGNGVDGGT
jgi:hypothetical protein